MATKITRIAQNLGNFRFQIELDTTVFILVFKFNTRADVWYFDLLQSNGTPIKYGIKVTTGFPWLRQIAASIRPLGDLLAIDSSQQDLEADFDSLGTLVQFLYEEAATVPT